MAFHLIVTCVSQKHARRTVSFLDPAIKPGPPQSVFIQWKKLLSSTDIKPKRAIDLYKGALWNSNMDAWGIVNGRQKEAKLWILSAGHGLISSNDMIVPYDITFQEQKSGVPSIHNKITGVSKSEGKKTASQIWWKMLIQNNERIPSSIEGLVANSSKNDYFFIILGKDYLDAVYEDIRDALKCAKRPDRLVFISNNVNDPTAKKLSDNWLYASNNFVNLSHTNSITVNAKIASNLLWHMFYKQSGLTWWSKDNFDEFLAKTSRTLPARERQYRTVSHDEEIKAFIRENIAQLHVPYTKLHRIFRNSGHACEYTRFRELYKIIIEESEIRVPSQSPSMIVKYNPRKTKTRFFLPDWDDRVDPGYDFINDTPTPHRKPYENDAYHYELYGSLNCDGILVSKSVLEKNSTKKEKVRLSGIHKYLRLPSGVPVIGDCGAFNYILEDIPPYNTEEILNYYQDLGFDLGVSIDHLIVPGIISKRCYFIKTEYQWVEINKEEFERLKVIPGTVVKNKCTNLVQCNLFAKNVTLAEIIIVDENKRDRRYNLTIENAANFIKSHRRKGFTFTPIGAVQGWDAESYAHAAKQYKYMGYEYIALGGLVRSKTEEILNILEKVREAIGNTIKIHIFGVARLDAIEAFSSLNVASVDSAGMLRQAWLSSTDNYHSPDGKHYTAIRVPDAAESPKSIKIIESGVISHKELVRLERECLSALRAYDQDKISLNKVLEKIKRYSNYFDIPQELLNKYERTLEDRPWNICDCKLCCNTGIDIIIFRGNNRNRRRGFHNTWAFFNNFKKTTDF